MDDAWGKVQGKRTQPGTLFDKPVGRIIKKSAFLRKLEKTQKPASRSNVTELRSSAQSRSK